MEVVVNFKNKEDEEFYYDYVSLGAPDNLTEYGSFDAWKKANQDTIDWIDRLMDYERQEYQEDLIRSRWYDSIR